MTTAPQIIATVFFLASLGSVLTLAILSAATAALDAVAAACRRTGIRRRAVHSRRAAAACAVSRLAGAGFRLQ
jgi:hypothetical protein